MLFFSFSIFLKNTKKYETFKINTKNANRHSLYISPEKDIQ